MSAYFGVDITTMEIRLTVRQTASQAIIAAYLVEGIRLIEASIDDITEAESYLDRYETINGGTGVQRREAAPPRGTPRGDVYSNVSYSLRPALNAPPPTLSGEGSATSVAVAMEQATAIPAVILDNPAALDAAATQAPAVPDAVMTST